MVEYMLTTIDNPYDPFTEYDNWYAFDTRTGHYTPAYLGRIVLSSDDLSEEDQKLAIQQAIDEIVALNPSGIYRKVSQDSPRELFNRNEKIMQEFLYGGGEGAA